MASKPQERSNWRLLPDNIDQRGAPPTREGTASPSVEAIAAVLPSVHVGGGGAAPAPPWEGRTEQVPGDGTKPKQPGAAPGSSGGEQWNLPSKVLSIKKGPPQDGLISLFDESVAVPPGMCTPMVVFVGPLFPSAHQRNGMEETKRKCLYNLIRRAHGHQDVSRKLNAYLTRINTKESEIRQRYEPSQCCWVQTRDLVEMMVLDGLFIIEVLINHWIGKIDRGSASPPVRSDTEHRDVPEKGGSDYRPPLASVMVPQALREDFTPLQVSWEPSVLRFDLITVANQIPFFVLEELFRMTEIPELGESQNKSITLKEIILDYFIGDAGDALDGYKGPVYHILHLVHLYLTFSTEDRQVSPLQPITRLSLADRALQKLKRNGMDLRAMYKRIFSRSTNIPVGWKDWKVIPPLRELVRVGVKLKPAVTHRFAEVKFKNGVLEIPAFTWRRYHIRLLTNLVVLEVSGWWPAERRLFCSYVMFMADLVMEKRDTALLLKKGILQQNNSDDAYKSLMGPLRILADLSHGSKYDCRFANLVDDMVKCYHRWSKTGIVTTVTKPVTK